MVEGTGRLLVGTEVALLGGGAVESGVVCSVGMAGDWVGVVVVVVPAGVVVNWTRVAVGVTCVVVVI